MKTLETEDSSDDDDKQNEKKTDSSDSDSDSDFSSSKYSLSETTNRWSNKYPLYTLIYKNSSGGTCT